MFWLETLCYLGLCVADSIRSEEITQDLTSEFVRLHILRLIEFETSVENLSQGLSIIRQTNLK